MASIRKIEGKNGVSFKITVSMGRDAQDNQLRHYKTWKPDKPMTAKQAEREAQRVAYEFERDLLLGFQADSRQTFAEYAEHVYEIKEQEGSKPQTLARISRQLEQINAHIGSMKLSEIKPQHITAMYKKMREPGENRWMRFAYPTIDFSDILGDQQYKAFGKKFGIDGKIIKRLCDGHCISLKNAEIISKGLNRADLFRIEGRNAGLAPTTIHSIHGTVYAVFAQAFKEMILVYNPAERATLPKKIPVRDVKTLQPEMIAVLLDKLKSEPIEFQTLITLFAVSGCRRGELLALKWNNVDFDKKQIHVESSLNYLSGVGVYEGTTKTGNERTIPLPDYVFSLLRKHRANQNEYRLSIGDLWQDHGYVFTRRDGTATNPNAVNLLLSDFCKRHGLPHINPHQFRHTAASILLSNGIDVLTVSKILGHANTTTTLDIYGHAIDEAKAKAAECVSEIILNQKKAQ